MNIVRSVILSHLLLVATVALAQLDSTRFDWIIDGAISSVSPQHTSGCLTGEGNFFLLWNSPWFSGIDAGFSVISPDGEFVVPPNQLNPNPIPGDQVGKAFPDGAGGVIVHEIDYSMVYYIDPYGNQANFRHLLSRYDGMGNQLWSTVALVPIDSLGSYARDDSDAERAVVITANHVFITAHCYDYRVSSRCCRGKVEHRSFVELTPRTHARHAYLAGTSGGRSPWSNPLAATQQN